MDSRTLVQSYLAEALRLKGLLDKANNDYIKSQQVFNEINDEMNRRIAANDIYGVASYQGRLNEVTTDRNNKYNDMIRIQQLYDKAESDYQSKKETLLSPTEQAQQEADEQTAREVAENLAATKASQAKAAETEATTKSQADRLKNYLIYGGLALLLIIVIIFAIRYFRKKK